MATTTAPWAIQAPRPVCAPIGVDDDSDGHLLDLFIQQKDESAFAELVHRHGAMVLGVCQRVLDNPHDAEDCFQAAFLVLVRKAATIRPRQMVGNWLYGVAYRTALEARKMAARRRNRERKKYDMPRPETDEGRWQELKPLLDQEMSRLPDKYRFVVIACDLEGRTRKDVARSLDVPEGTVASRLARGRTMLAKRLNRHNVTLSVGALTALLAQQASAAYVPAHLAASTTSAAALLAAGKPVAALVSGNVATLMGASVQSMLWAKLQIASVISLLLVALGLGVGALLPSTSAEHQPEVQPKAVEVRQEKPEQIQECVIESIDTGAMTIQAARPNDNNEIVLYVLHTDATTAVVIDGKNAGFTDLKVGDCINITLQRGPDGKACALRIETVGQTLGGVVQDVNNNAVTIQSDNKPPKAGVKKTYDVDSGTWVYVNGKKSKLADVKLKMHIDLYVSVRKPVVAVVTAAGPKVAGVLKSIDAERRRLSLGGEGIRVSPDALVRIDGKQARLADLRAGMNVTLQMSAETEPGYVVGITSQK